MRENNREKEKEGRFYIEINFEMKKKFYVEKLKC